MAKNNKKMKKGASARLVLMIAVIAVAVIAAWTMLRPEDTDHPSGNRPAVPHTSAPAVELPIPTLEQPEAMDPMVLGEGLQITRIDSYAGMFLEDGSDEIVSDVQMILVENTASKDLQFARIELVFESHTAEFEATNLPAGETVLLLEKSRQPAADQEPLSARLKNVIFFQDPMETLEKYLQFEGHNGYIDVTNISDEDLTERIYVYYKNYVNDLYYGGITYRIRIDGGLGAGETARITAAHYYPDTCQILMVTHGS